VLNPYREGSADSHRFFTHAIAGILIGACGLTTAHAQIATGAANGQTPSSDSQKLEDIIVYAQRRAENIQDIPITITAVTASELTKQGITDTEGLTRAIAGLNTYQIFGFLNLLVRGVGTTTAVPGIENSVATYIDGVYLPFSPSTLLNLNNIQSVEVLKGPQGTLFGRNATGGVLQIITKEPTQEFQGNISSGVDNYATVKSDLYVTGGITSNLAADLAIDYSNQLNGYGRNIYTGSDTNKAENFDARSKWLWTPTAQDRLTLTVDYEQLDSSETGLRYVYGFAHPLSLAAYSAYCPSCGFSNPPPSTFSNPWDYDSAYDPINKYQQLGISLREQHDFDFANFVSLTAYRHTDSYYLLDYNPPPNDVDDASADPVRTLTQEFQLLAPGSSAVKWVAGLFYMHNRVAIDPDNEFGPFYSLLGNPQTHARLTQNSGAAYGQATVPLPGVKDTDLTVGLRYSKEHQTFGYSQQLAAMGLAYDVAPFSTSQSFDKVTWHAALDHHFTPGVMAYVSASRGFKAGGYDMSEPKNPPLKPETLDSYEVGLKATLFDDRLRLNGAFFYYVYTNMQVQFSTITGPYELNAAQAKAHGIDLDAEATVTEAFHISTSLEWLHARFTSFAASPSFPVLTAFPYGECNSCVADATGHQLPATPEFTINVSPDYDFPLSFGDLDLSFSVYYNSGWYASPDNRLRQSSYESISARSRWTSPDKRFQVSLWGKNLANEQIASNLLSDVAGDTESLAPPRTYGLTAQYSF
jgi:iron complex outermembrane recepter protein